MKIDQYINILNHTELFSTFTPDKMKSFFSTKHYSISKFSKNQIIYFEGEMCKSFDIILDGNVVVQKIDQNGNVLTVTEFNRGDNLGGNLLFSKFSYYPMTIMAKTNTKILHIDKSFILDLCQENRDFLVNYLTCISDKTMILTDKIKSISLKSIRESIIDYLKYEYLSQNNMRILLNGTKKELAERLGIQRTSLSRELNKMKKAGLVDYDARSITVLSPVILKSNQRKTT